MYDQAYAAWKNWNPETFGRMTRAEARYYAAEMARLRRCPPVAARVVEIGFGNGQFLSFCRDRGWQVSGTEANDGLVRMARAAGYDALPLDALQTLPAASVDLVAAFDVLEHLTLAGIVDLLRDVRRILAADGMFVARFPNGDSPFGLPYQNGDPTHVTTIGSARIRQLAQAAGLTVDLVAGEARPLLAGGWRLTLHRLVANPVRNLLDGFVNTVIVPRGDIRFTSPNLSVFCSKAGAP